MLRRPQAMSSNSPLLLCVCIFAAVGASSAFMAPSSFLPRVRETRVFASTCTSPLNLRMSAKDSDANTDRRSFMAAALALVAMPKKALSDESPVVVAGEMRLEVGSDKKLATVGGKALATVTLRIVGKGIISKTSVEVNLPDFPAPGQPKPGENGGVPFVVRASDLVAKTEKGFTVTKELWDEDDIFVAVDVTGSVNGKEKRVLRGIGKAKMKPVDGVNAHQKPLVLLE